MRQLFPPGRRGASDSRWLVLAVLFGVLTWLGNGEVARLLAQEPAGKAEAPAAKDAAPPKDDAAAPAAEAAAAPAANGNATPNNAAGAGTAPDAPGNLLSLAIRASGPIGGFLLLLSIYFTALVIRLFMELRVSEAVPAPLVERLEAAIRDKKFQDAYDACKDNESFLARLVRVGIANLPNGRQEAKDTMLEASDEITTSLEMKISYLAIIGTLGPMIGLVGTIAGMIDSFKEIAIAGGAQPKPEKVAMGISMALFITLEGVSLSVPAIFFFAFFRNRIAQMTMEATRVADRTINSLVAAAKAAKTA
jgi:biopolymer transport protein ExbB